METGCYSKPKTPSNERLCRVSVEDETYFLIDCQSYTDLSTTFIQIQQTRNGLLNADINNSILNGGGKEWVFIIFDYNEHRLS